MKDLKYWIWLSILNLRPIEKIVLLEKYKNPKNIFKLKEKDLPDKIKSEVLNENNKKVLDEKLNLIDKEKIDVINIFDERYPNRLKNIYGFPIVLYARGNLDLLNKEYNVSIVGCRDCSNYGKEIAYKLSYNLSKKDIVIVSGMAKGIDTFSHHGALSANKNTIAVLGSGIDYIYPKENKKLYERILSEGGLIISEYVARNDSSKRFFPYEE